MAKSEGYVLDEKGNAVPQGEAPAGKSTAKAKTKAPKEPKPEGTPGAPRPRKYDYGIAPGNTVSVADPKAEPKLKAQEAEGYATAQKGCTVEEFLKAHDRGILRRLSRKELVVITGPSGQKYPVAYQPKEPEPKAPAAEKGKSEEPAKTA